jgi:hypothetical protein
MSNRQPTFDLELPSERPAEPTYVGPLEILIAVIAVLVVVGLLLNGFDRPAGTQEKTSSDRPTSTATTTAERLWSLRTGSRDSQLLAVLDHA